MGRWLDEGNPLLAFPHHWLRPGACGAPLPRRITDGAPKRDPAREAALLALLQSHQMDVLVPLLERSYGGGGAGPVQSHASLEVANALLIM